jgi:hypothetical protein
MQPDDRHGDERHIIMQDLIDAAKSNGKPVDQVFQTIEKTTKQVLDGKLESKSWKPGQ